MIDEDPPEETPSEPPKEHQRESVRSRLESIIPEILKRAVEIGVEKARESPDNLKQFVHDLKVPKEVAHLLFQQIDDTKNGLYGVVAKEIRDFLEHTNFSGEVQKLLTTVQFEVNTTIRFTPNERKQDESAGESGEGEEKSDESAEESRPLPKPEVKTSVRVPSQRPSRSPKATRFSKRRVIDPTSEHALGMVCPMAKPLKAGGEVDSWCTKCKLVLNHRIIAMVGSTPVRVECSTCSSHHNFRAKAPGEKASAAGGSTTRASSSGSSGPRSVRGPTKAQQAVMDRERTWEKSIAGKGVHDFRQYRVSEIFEEGDLVRHSKFGDGVVTRLLEGKKVEILFKDDARTLAHGLTD